MYCSKCGTQISDTSTFCSSCGYKIEISSDSKNSNEEIIVSGEIVNTDFKVTSFIKKEKKTWNGFVTFLVAFTITLFILYLIPILKKSNFNTKKNKVNTEENVPNKGCVGFGDESCIDRVRENFTNTGKQILGEEYLDNGQFGISFLDPSRGQTYNSKVSTDCDCKIINVSVQVMR